MNMLTPVIYLSEFWRDFSTPPSDYGDAGHGPSSCNLWIYYPKSSSMPHGGYITDWLNWSNSDDDIKRLKEANALWCFKLPPKEPK